MSSVEKTLLRDVSFAHFQQYKQHFIGWEYPKREISSYISYLDSGQQLAVNAWGWIAMIIFVGSPILAWYLSSYWWLIGVLLSLIVWGGNRKSMEEFFLEKLETDENFYKVIQKSKIAEDIKLLWK